MIAKCAQLTSTGIGEQDREGLHDAVLVDAATPGHPDRLMGRVQRAIRSEVADAGDQELVDGLAHGSLRTKGRCLRFWTDLSAINVFLVGVHRVTAAKDRAPGCRGISSGYGAKMQGGSSRHV